MAKMPETIEAQLILRYPTGKETALGAITIEVHAAYHFEFTKTGQPVPEGAITDSLARITEPASPLEAELHKGLAADKAGA